MRQQDQQTHDDERADRNPVQVDDRDRTDDRDLDGPDPVAGRDLDDPVGADTNDRTDNLDLENARNHTDDLVRDDPDRTEYHEPAPLPTTFGAPTVGGAVAASALASGDRTAELDAREDKTVAPDNGTTDNDSAPGDGTTGDTTTGRQSANGHAGDGPALRPGATTATASPAVDDKVGPLLAPETTGRLRDRWREMQVRFVDDPPGALGEARELVDEAVRSLTSALAEQRDRLDQDGRDGAGPDDTGETERIRLAIRRYRDFLDRLLDR